MNIPAVATLRFHQLPLDPSSLHWIDSTQLDPGEALDVTLALGSQKITLFDGEIVEVEPQFGSEGNSLVVRAFDKLHRLSRGRKVETFKNVTNKDILSKIVQTHGLQFNFSGGKGDANIYEQVLQNGQTDLDFARDRAAMMGCHCIVKGAKFVCGLPGSPSPVVTLDQSSLVSFRPRLTTADQVNQVTVRGWKPAEKKEIVGVFSGMTKVDSAAIAGKTGADFAKKASGAAPSHLVTDWLVTDQDQAQSIAEAIGLSVSGRSIQAEGTTYGDPAIVAGAWIKIADVGKRYGGTYFVTNALHVYDARGGYMTEFTISGHDPTTLLHLLANQSNEAARTGLQLGVVTEVDPKKALAKVSLPHLSANTTTGWARVVAVGAGNTRGIQFLPEVNDEVIVGFERGDINSPFVLGGLWNGKDSPPVQVGLDSGKVAERVIQSRNGHVITFDDKGSDGALTIKDSAGSKITLSAKDKSITIESTGDVTVKATGDLKMSGVNLSIEGTQGVAIKGPLVKINGDAQIEIKGGIVKIN